MNSKNARIDTANNAIYTKVRDPPMMMRVIGDRRPWNIPIWRQITLLARDNAKMSNRSFIVTTYAFPALTKTYINVE